MLYHMTAKSLTCSSFSVAYVLSTFDDFSINKHRIRLMVKINELLKDQRSCHKLDSNQHLWEEKTDPANFLLF